MVIVDKEKIVSSFNEAKALDEIRRAFIKFSAGRADVAAVGHFNFADPPGDCHIKSARIDRDPIFVVKIASSFYANPQRGLSSSQGMMLIFSAVTGETLAILNDGGFLTDQRTALAGVLAAQAIVRPGSKIMGIVGTGIQARLQANALARHLGFEKILVWGRNPGAARALAADLGGEFSELADLARTADLIVTTTPSMEPLIKSSWISAGARIVAVGADSPGKRELEPEILARAKVVTDARAQCLHHGETSWAANAGILDPDALLDLGALLENKSTFASNEIVVVDLTGVAIQDVAIANHIWNQMNAA